MPIIAVRLRIFEMDINSPGSAEEIESQPGVVQRRIVLSFCATVLVGVLVCAGYLARGATRSTAHAMAKSAFAVQAASVAAPIKLPSIPVPAPPPPSVPEPSARVDTRGTPAASSPRSGRPIQGATYLQMAAVDRGVAEVFLEVLHRKGFQAVITKGPTEDIFRVLVGPVNDADSLARVKAGLQAAGFTSFPRKLTGE